MHSHVPCTSRIDSLMSSPLARIMMVPLFVSVSLDLTRFVYKHFGLSRVATIFVVRVSLAKFAGV